MANTLKLTQKSKRRFVELLGLGHTICSAAEATGVTRHTVLNHRKADAAFDEAVREALGLQIQLMEDALYATAIGGNVTAMIFWLCNRTKFRPPEERWQHVQHIRHGGDDEAPPIRHAAVDLSKLSDDELRILIAIRDKVKSA